MRKIHTVMEDDDPDDKILDAAKRENADFIVLGRRGLAACHGMLSGSVSTKVGHMASATVISVT